MKRILLYSPDVVGHPRVYCRVIADALADCDCELVVAMGFTDEVGLAQSADLHPIVDRPRLTLVDTRDHSATRLPHLNAEELVALQSRLGIDTTLFIEADKSNDEFSRIAAGKAPRLLGRNLGIFAKTAEWYPGEDSYTGERLSLIGPTLRRTLGKLRDLLFRREPSLRHFYERTILASGVLDEIIVKDERLSDWRGPPVYWMPEISRPATEIELPGDAEAVREQAGALDRFMAANPGREPALYFGDAAFYKGYDLFLQFIATTPEACAIHAGRSYDERQRSYFHFDVDALRALLLAEGRLYETNDYVHSQRLKELFFGSTRVYITTHRLALSSSTVIQALELGRPVLVPDRGLLGFRVRANDLGGVYEYENIDELREKSRALWAGNPGRFAEKTKSYWRRFSHDSIRDFFRERLLES